ncbi:unnamed protein product [Pleuronectes platessa]|uniref:Uncharacterized protein n=1 Tax=Pleuronectes platessa TaxID=8262 RepID=A0A9N7YE95_PLEPL|nr:unnamed protein product [Pleuronectes platessa]
MSRTRHNNIPHPLWNKAFLSAQLTGSTSPQLGSQTGTRAPPQPEGVCSLNSWWRLTVSRRLHLVPKKPMPQTCSLLSSRDEVMVESCSSTAAMCSAALQLRADLGSEPTWKQATGLGSNECLRCVCKHWRPEIEPGPRSTEAEEPAETSESSDLRTAWHRNSEEHGFITQGKQEVDLQDKSERPLRFFVPVRFSGRHSEEVPQTTHGR